MPAPVAVEPQCQLREWRWQQIEPWLELAPQRHQPEVRDVAVDQREDSPRTVIRVQSDHGRLGRAMRRLAEAAEPGAAGGWSEAPHGPLHRQTDLRSIPPFLHGFDDLRVGHVELADASQRVAHDG